MLNEFVLIITRTTLVLHVVMLLTPMTLSKIFTIILIFCLRNVCSFGLLKPELSQDNLNLIEALRVFKTDLIATPFAVGYTLVSIQDPKFKNIHDAVKSEILKNTFKDKIIRISNTNESIPFSSKFSTIIIDNISAFRDSKDYIDVKRLHSAGFQIVILLNGTIDDVHEIFSTFWFKNIFNVMTFINHNGTLLLTFDPFADPQKCGDTSPRVINRLENGKFINKIIKNWLNGCCR